MRPLKFFSIFAITLLSLNSVWGTNEFLLSAQGRLNISPSSSIVTSRAQAQTIKNRLMAIRAKLNRNKLSSQSSKDLAKLVRDKIASYRPFNFESMSTDLSQIREGLKKLEEEEGPAMKEIFSDRGLRSLLSFDSVNEMNRLVNKDSIPRYCENYPLLDRDQLGSFYNNIDEGFGSGCYNIDGLNLKLDIADIGQALTKIEDEAFAANSESLKREMIEVATAKILEESSTYANIFNGTDPDLSLLKGCALGGRLVGGRRVGEPHDELVTLVDDHKESLSSVENGNPEAREEFLKEHIKQALIVGNLYEVKDQADSRNREANQHQRRINERRCQEVLLQATGSLYVERAVDIDSTVFNHCPSLIESGRFNSTSACRSDIVKSTNNEGLNQRYNECMADQSHAQNYDIGSIIPVMAKKLDEFPLLFKREDNSNLIPFSESKSDFIPSDFSQRISLFPGASDISKAINNLLLTNPSNPEAAIESLLSQSPLKEKVEEIVSQSRKDSDIKDLLKNEVKDYRRQITRSAQRICENKGEYLHHFPEIVEALSSKRINNSNLSVEQKREELARTQAAQCHLLQTEPPGEEGGLPVAYQALGIAGVVVLGLVPGVGTAAALLAGAIGVGDGYIQNDEADRQFQATQAAFFAGATDAQEVLDTAARRTDSRLSLSSEVLLVGGEGISLLNRGVRALRSGAESAPVSGFTSPSISANSLPAGLRRRVRGRLGSHPGLPTPASSYNVTSSVGNIDTSRELLRFKSSFNDDILNRFGIDGLQNYNNPAELQAYRDIMEQFFEPGRGFVLNDGELNNVLLDRLKFARCLVANNLSDTTLAKQGACSRENLASFSLSSSELEELKRLGPIWDQRRESFGAERLALGDRRTQLLKKELEQEGLTRTKDVNCATVSKLSPGFAERGGSCFAFNTKDQPEALKGAFCSCGSGNASNWMIRCPRNDNEYLRSTNYYDQISLFKNESLNCFRVSIPDNATCFAGPAGPRRGGLGGMSQIFCPNRFVGDHNLRRLPDGVTEQQITDQAEEAWNTLGIDEDWRLIRSRGSEKQVAGGNPGYSFTERIVGWSPNPQSEVGVELVNNLRRCISTVEGSGCSASELAASRVQFTNFLDRNTEMGAIDREIKREGRWTWESFEEPISVTQEVDQNDIDGIRRYGCQFLMDSSMSNYNRYCINDSRTIDPVNFLNE